MQRVVETVRDVERKVHTVQPTPGVLKDEVCNTRAGPAAAPPRLTRRDYTLLILSTKRCVAGILTAMYLV